jgi:hypothetical protein
MNLTEFGFGACDELSRLSNYLLSSSISIGESGTPSPTKEGTLTVFYDQSAKMLLAEFGVCRAVDIYQWYNRQILRLAVRHDPNVLTGFKANVGLPSGHLQTLIESGSVPEEVLARISFRDKEVRDHLHKTLNVFKDSPMQLFVEARNCIVHALGRDTDGRVAAAVAATPSGRTEGITIKDGIISVSTQSAIGCTNTVDSQISIMDQELAFRYRLPTKPWSAMDDPSRRLIARVQKHGNE